MPILAPSPFPSSSSSFVPMPPLLETCASVSEALARLSPSDRTLCPSEVKYVPHFEGDADLVQDLGWDLVIAHPPCTYLSNAGLRWIHSNPERLANTAAAAAQFRRCLEAKAPFLAVENPKMHYYAKALLNGIEATQYVHPWQHGTGHTKTTGLYLSASLPPLQPTCIVPGSGPRGRDG